MLERLKQKSFYSEQEKRDMGKIREERHHLSIFVYSLRFVCYIPQCGDSHHVDFCSTEDVLKRLVFNESRPKKLKNFQ